MLIAVFSPRYPLKDLRLAAARTLTAQKQQAQLVSTFRVCLVGLWAVEKLLWTVSSEKTAVSYQLWESLKPFGWNSCETVGLARKVCNAPGRYEGLLICKLIVKHCVVHLEREFFFKFCNHHYHIVHMNTKITFDKRYMVHINVHH